MATGWADDGAVHAQIDASIADAVARARANLLAGAALSHCESCGNEIPIARQRAVPGVRLCVACQQQQDAHSAQSAGINRRGSKDSQLR